VAALTGGVGCCGLNLPSGCLWLPFGECQGRDLAVLGKEMECWNFEILEWWTEKDLE